MFVSCLYIKLESPLLLECFLLFGFRFSFFRFVRLDSCSRCQKIHSCQFHRPHTSKVSQSLRAQLRKNDVWLVTDFIFTPAKKPYVHCKIFLDDIRVVFLPSLARLRTSWPLLKNPPCYEWLTVHITSFLQGSIFLPSREFESLHLLLVQLRFSRCLISHRFNTHF
jgi:hypothetical protein